MQPAQHRPIQMLQQIGGVRKKNSYLPYIKALFLGWFEPVRDAITAETMTWASKKQHCRPIHAPFFEYLPAEKMAVITIYKLLGLLTTNSGGAGAAKVVQPACAIGEALGNEVGCRFIQLFMETAYIQPSVDQLGDAPPDICPAFVHSLKTITKDGQKTNKRYGVIECGPFIRKGMVKIAKYMVIPYNSWFSSPP